MKHINCGLLIVGAGPGGYVCAIRAGQLGIDTVIVEEAKPGGTCLNVGCIPSKALIHAADMYHKIDRCAGGSDIGITAASPVLDFAKTIAWKDTIVGRLNAGVSGLLKKAKVRHIAGTARFQDGKTVRVEGTDGPATIHADHVVIATGSTPVELPFLPFGGKVISSTEALSLAAVPKSLAIVGGGYIGLEIGTAFAKLGSAVTVVEAEPRVLPQFDAALSKPVAASMAQLGITVLTGTKAREESPSGLIVEDAEGVLRDLPATHILVTVGRRPRSDSADLPQLDLDMEGAFLKIDDCCRTSMRNVFAIGDVTGEPMLAHRAMAQGEMVADIVAGHSRRWDDKVIPAVCFTDPEIVTCGVTPAEARAAGIDTVTGQFPFTANGRAMTLENETGFVRVVARASDHVIIGIQAVGAGVSEMSSAFGVAMEMGAVLEDIGQIVQAHPTQSEGFQEAALGALEQALHI